MSFYISYNDTVYYLDATTSISVTKSAKLTTNPTADKKNRSDNYIIESPTASYSGVVTDIITPSSLKKMSTGDYIDALNSAMESKSAVGFRYRLDREEEFDWYITALTTNQNNSVGYGGTTPEKGVIQAFNIDISLQKALYTDIVQVEFTVPAAVKDDLDSKKVSSGLPKEKEDTLPSDLPGSLQAISKAAESQQNARFYRREGQYGVIQDQIDEFQE